MTDRFTAVTYSITKRPVVPLETGDPAVDRMSFSKISESFPGIVPSMSNFIYHNQAFSSNSAQRTRLSDLRGTSAPTQMTGILPEFVSEDGRTLFKNYANNHTFCTIWTILRDNGLSNCISYDIKDFLNDYQVHNGLSIHPRNSAPSTDVYEGSRFTRICNKDSLGYSQEYIYQHTSNGFGTVFMTRPTLMLAANDSLAAEYVHVLGAKDMAPWSALTTDFGNNKASWVWSSSNANVAAPADSTILTRPILDVMRALKYSKPCRLCLAVDGIADVYINGYLHTSNFTSTVETPLLQIPYHASNLDNSLVISARNNGSGDNPAGLLYSVTDDSNNMDVYWSGENDYLINSNVLYPSTQATSNWNTYPGSNQIGLNGVSYPVYYFYLHQRPFWINSLYDYGGPGEVPATNIMVGGLQPGWRCATADATFVDSSDSGNPIVLVLNEDRLLKFVGYTVGCISDQPTDIAPSSWTLEGSVDDGSSWVVLDTRSGESGWTQGETRQYSLAIDHKLYRRFRFTFLRNNSSTPTYIGLANLLINSIEPCVT